jgi:hypothetical protein
MQSEIKVGQRFKFNILSDNRAPERQAVVARVLSVLSYTATIQQLF